ncbi:MAG TPA: DUF4013 domain-containing protein [Methanobacterium sp.]|mgnify:CR=1 FL=1|jgi:hypothetical protein|nr:DUF4013 domain-containing protein [Methanobacterium sp.]HOI40227.1 DUF4013 domain-containing protein [Methanobacterium sp.]
MEIGEIISDSIRFPSRDWTKILILGILFLTSFIIIIPIFLVMGYCFRILKSSIAGFSELPDFDMLGEMFVDGLNVFIVTLVYFLIPIVVIIIGGWTSIASVSITGMADPTIFIALLGGISLIGVVLAIVFGLMAIIAIANMALYDSELGAAFRFGEILEQIAMIGWGKYLVWYIVMIVIGVIGGVVTSFLSQIPLIGMIIAILLIYPYLYIFYARSLALIFKSTVEMNGD